MRRGIWQDLWRRRVPHAVGVYLGISWGVLEFVGFMVDQYFISPHLITFSLVVLASLLPSVSVVAYFHGTPGRQGWSRIEKVTLPTNLLALGVVLAVMFSGKDLGATTTQVTVTNEEGVTTERVIPKSEFRRKVVLFPFENVSGDSTLDWLRYGFPLGVWVDLRQDMFVSATDGLTIRDQMTEAGYADGLGMPASLMRSIARGAHIDRYATGSIATAEGEISVTITLHDAGRGRVVDERSFTGTDAFELIDSMSVQVKRGLEVPARQLEEADDLPFSEIQTGSLAAYQATVAGYTAIVVHGDWEAAARMFEQAVAEDPTYASAQHSLFQVYAYSNRVQDGIEPIQAAMQHIYRLPEREQFEVKSDYYFTRQDYDRAAAVFEMAVELYPSDVEGRAALAQLLLVQDKREAAVEQYLKILEIDPERYDILRQVGAVYESQGRFEDALEYYEAYAEEFPDDQASFTVIGELYSNMGNHEQAKEYLEKALLIDPNDVSAMVRLAEIHWDLGDFEQARAHLEEASAAARTPEDLTTAYEGFRAHYESQGQLDEAIEYANLAQEQRQAYLPPFASIVARFRSLGIYVHAGRAEEAFETLEAVKAELAPPWDRFIPLGELTIYLEMEEPDSAERALAGVESFIEDFSYQMLEPLVLDSRGRIREMRGEFEEAIQAYKRELELQPTDESIHEKLGRCHRELGESEAAQDQLLEALAIHPFNASTRYEMALVQEQLSDVRAAVEHLRIALDVWREADPGFEPAERARAELAELGAG